MDIHKLITTVWHSYASSIGRANALFSSCYISHVNSMTFLRGDEKYYIHFVDILLLLAS